MDIEKLGQNIKYYRKQKGLTQKELASLISKTESSVRKYEKGIIDIPNKVVSEISLALNVTSEQLLGLDNIPVIEVAQSRQMLSNRKIVEAAFTFLEEIVYHHEEIKHMNLDANEMITKDNCFFRLLMQNLIEATVNMSKGYDYRRRFGLIKPLDKEITLNLGRKETIYSNGLVKSGAVIQVPLINRFSNEEYLKFLIDELESKLREVQEKNDDPNE